MTERHLTITLQPDWQSVLRAMTKTAQADKYQGEVLSRPCKTPATRMNTGFFV